MSGTFGIRMNLHPFGVIAIHLVHPANAYLTASLQDDRYNGNPFPVTEVTGFTTQPLRGYRFPEGEQY
jgi:hypothetical protein